jgi:uncharacterized protein (UPF0335 family)
MRNTVAGEELRSFIERVERIREEKVQLADDEKAVMAEAKSNGFSPAIMRSVLKVRKMRPADREEAESLLDLYLSALGMAKEAPLFRHVGLMSVDKTAKDSVVEAFKQLVPTDGEIIIKMGGAPIRLFRTKDGEAQAEDVIERPQETAPAGAPAPSRRRPPREVPDCTEEEARELGAAAAKENQPVIANPFPWDDTRRARWDEGWRREAGSDGMGPDEDKG